MLSILIPTYNWNAYPLVKELHKQLEQNQIQFEIICIDDASNSSINFQNQKINSLSNSCFEILKKNVGRSSIRNLLVRKAIHDWLLFLDADVMPVSKKFISKYIEETEKNVCSIFLGGIAYIQDSNSNKIRWKLGQKGEMKSVEVRNKNPYNYFFTANFLIKKEVFSTVKFDEGLTKYGYEDLLFAKELAHQKETIRHINNPVIHNGIDDNIVFIEKTKLALENLSTLIKTKKISKEDTKVYKTYSMLNKYRVANFLTLFTSFFERQTIKKSSLLYYHFFRLAYLQKIIKDT